MIALAPKTYTCSINSSNISKSEFEKNNFNNIRTTATKCKGYSRDGRLYFKDYFDVYTERKTIQGTNNTMQMKSNIDDNTEKDKVLTMTNVSVTKNVLTATHTKYRVSKDFSTCTPLFLPVNE